MAEPPPCALPPPPLCCGLLFAPLVLFFDMRYLLRYVMRR